MEIEIKHEIKSSMPVQISVDILYHRINKLIQYELSKKKKLERS